ncbi:MAG: MauE/DoxX family redox-associated membrane protein [Candidatus Hydrogenedentales bacterium]
MRNVKSILRYLLAVFFIGSGINHFMRPEFYVSIMPDYLPLHRELVLLSGVTEIIAGILVAIPATARWGAWLIMAHLVVFMTVHIHMIVHADRYPEAPLAALYVRIVMQFVLIAWAWWYTRPAKVVRPVPLAPQEG